MRSTILTSSECWCILVLTFQFTSLSNAGAFAHQTLDVLRQDSVVLEDLVDVDVVVFGGVLVGLIGLGGGDERCTDDCNQQKAPHLVDSTVTAMKTKVTLTNCLQRMWSTLL
ncbi:hypothetical protein LSTR_LSTR007537 [Laodelphax striatellus]|uniref:Secreted protein n=1 Tax=Laodelphax striatellus TaxID=195883 RepID=A0A482XS87_LAOST|nr:hypothetical protein LSTR_LSTR007537 [Laodelphax striatellus]